MPSLVLLKGSTLKAPLKKRIPPCQLDVDGVLPNVVKTNETNASEHKKHWRIQPLGKHRPPPELLCNPKIIYRFTG
jgi:hypothetical protein